jgi:fumarate reductase flavoprotein subunit
MIRPEAILVNKNGERYSDEALFLNYHNWPGNSLSRQPGNMCYALLDEEIKRDIIQKRDSLGGFFKSIGENGAWMDELGNDLQKESTGGKIKIADSWNDIAGWIKVAPEVLKATVEQYNSFCAKGYDADFLKDKKYLRPLRTPPYYAIPGHQCFDTTIGGIRINHRMEVINKQVSPISGLYAAGDNAGSWLAQNYDLTYPGSALGFALVSGQIAGENAARFVLGK